MIPAWVEKTDTFIRKHAAAEKPFFVYFAPICPHRPINPNQQFLGKSACGVFGDFVMELDWAVGRILSTLEEARVADNTLVVFTADNGAENNAYQHIEEYAHWSSGGLRGVKRDLYEGGHHVPFIVRWPGEVPAGKRSAEILCLTDLMRTTAAIVGVDLPADAAEDSYNMLPAFRGQKQDRPIREATVHHSARGKFGIRQGNWVYFDTPSGDENREPPSVREALGVVPHSEEAELFNLADDPKETTNLLKNCPEKAAELQALLAKYKADSTSLPLGVR
jgi:arylsulfatase A-like enzyme